MNSSQSGGGGGGGGGGDQETRRGWSYAEEDLEDEFEEEEVVVEEEEEMEEEEEEEVEDVEGDLPLRARRRVSKKRASSDLYVDLGDYDLDTFETDVEKIATTNFKQNENKKMIGRTETTYEFNAVKEPQRARAQLLFVKFSGEKYYFPSGSGYVLRELLLFFFLLFLFFFFWEEIFFGTI